MMPTSATEQQLAALAALKDAFLASNTPPPHAALLQPAQMLAEVALLLALPRPATAGEADEQIASLQSASLRGYAGAHPEWAFPVMSRVQQQLPDPAAVRSTQARGTVWTPAAWRSYVALLLHSARNA